MTSGAHKPARSTVGAPRSSQVYDPWSMDLLGLRTNGLSHRSKVTVPMLLVLLPHSIEPRSTRNGYCFSFSCT
ncbi:hypothetical protein I7I53_03949 [Histoplasma capsulatum var. duboisii H88]|uniref:Uncharacterized protein n=1 Tax=Ajellomyces capsulatus (strain H88) TaxID=544711 RepID=A0A8A1LVF9_AJEC8|nr:hypothetical protein I7I53_03949 [Histoplasma capsulatum var. duboisii H88]